MAAGKPPTHREQVSKSSTIAPPKFSRLTSVIAFPYCGLAFRNTCRRWQIQANRGELLILCGSMQSGATKALIKLATGQAAEDIHKRIDPLIKTGYIAKIQGSGPNANRYILAPLGIKFFNEYKREFSKIKKAYFG